MKTAKDFKVGDIVIVQCGQNVCKIKITEVTKHTLCWVDLDISDAITRNNRLTHNSFDKNFSILEMVYLSECDQLEKRIGDIYESSVNLWFSVADDNMKKSGHPGIPSSSKNHNDDVILKNKECDENYRMLLGTIETLSDVASFIRFSSEHIKKIHK